MDELSHVLREVLRALGMEGMERVHVTCGPPEGNDEPGDGAEEAPSAD